MKADYPDTVIRIIRDFIASGVDNVDPPCCFLGITGSLAKGDVNRLSDCDLLMVVDADPARFWRRLPRAAAFIGDIATHLQRTLGIRVGVSSSLIAQDLIPFVVADDAQPGEHLILHVLAYPTIDHFVRWEPSSVRRGLLKPLTENPKHCLVETVGGFAASMLATQSGAPRNSEPPLDDSLDVCIQAFMAGIIQAYCHELYRSDFVSKYSFHLFRYAAKYLIPLDHRMVEAGDLAGADDEPPVTAVDSRGALILILRWLSEWNRRGRVPQATQLPAMYDAATVYLSELFADIDGSAIRKLGGAGVQPRELFWGPQEQDALAEITLQSETPVFVLSRRRLLENASRATELLTAKFGPSTKVFYSHKTLPHPVVVELLMEKLPELGVAVASLRGLASLADMKLLPLRTLVHAPVMTPHLVSAICARGTTWTSINSIAQYDAICSGMECGDDTTLLARLSLPDDGLTKFGMSMEDVESIERRQESSCLSGFHVHLEAGLYDADIQQKVGEVVGRGLRLLSPRVRKPIVNLGGGWRSATCEKWLGIDGLSAFEHVVECIEESSGCGREDISFQFELGRRIVGDAVVAAGRIWETRGCPDGNVHLCDLGTGLLPVLNSTIYGVSTLQTGKEPRKLGFISGPACYEKDSYGGASVVAGVGDVVIFSNAGAYTLSFASGFGGFDSEIKEIDADLE